MSYLKILEIQGVDEDSLAGQFTKRVNIVKVLDTKGDPWNPGEDSEDITIVEPSTGFQIMFTLKGKIFCKNCCF